MAQQELAREEVVATPLLVPTHTSHRVESPGRRTLRRFMRHRLAMVGVVIIALISFLAIIGNEQMALQQNLRMGFTNQPPGAIPGYPLGTDALGRDVLSRTLVGGRVSILVAILSVAIATGIGTTVGVLSGYAGGWLDQSLMRFVDIVLSFPTILLLLVVALLVGPGLTTLVLMIGVVTWASGARIVRGQVLALREFTFIVAARVIGVPTPRMITTHILPNIVAPWSSRRGWSRSSSATPGSGCPRRRSSC
jgi:peptide/nickel transport system permease protein